MLSSAIQLCRHFLQWRAKHQLLRLQGVTVHPSAKVNYRRILLHGGRLGIGAGSMVEGSMVCERPEAQIWIGDNTFIGRSSLVAAHSISIGNDVLISWGCVLVDHNSHSLLFEERKEDVKNWYVGRKDWSHVAIKPVVIRDRAWIGFNAIILKGVTVGEGAVVGAGSVVTKNVPPYTVAAGNPATIVRTLASHVD